MTSYTEGSTGAAVRDDLAVENVANRPLLRVVVAVGQSMYQLLGRWAACLLAWSVSQSLSQLNRQKR